MHYLIKAILRHCVLLIEYIDVWDRIITLQLLN
jgi:hypothetical protein